jgi:excisionase family DNA binding protein
MSAPLTVGDAAKRLGVSTMRIYGLIRDGRLKTSRFGVFHMISEKDLKAVVIGKVGRPRKTATKAAARKARTAKS